MNNNVPLQDSSSSTASYASKIKKMHRITRFRNPVDEQAFIFNCSSEYKVKQYLHALKGKVGGPQNVIAASKIEDNQMVVHLISKEVLNSFIESSGEFELDSQIIKCRRLCAPKTKVMLSHVNPCIPDSVLVEYIKRELKLEIDRDEMTYLRVDPSDDEFIHVVSWRRQFFTTTQINKDKLPGSFLINYDNRNHRIFLTTDDFTCFKCHALGHKAEYCTATNAAEIEYKTNFPELKKNATLQETSSHKLSENYADQEKLNVNPEPMDIHITAKRPLSQTSSSTSISTPIQTSSQFKKKNSQ